MKKHEYIADRYFLYLEEISIEVSKKFYKAFEKTGKTVDTHGTKIIILENK